MHLLEGMLHGCRDGIRIIPAQLAQLVSLVRLQARRRRLEEGACRGSGNRGSHSKVDASPPRLELPPTIESRRYAELDEAQAAAALAACARAAASWPLM